MDPADPRLTLPAYLREVAARHGLHPDADSEEADPLADQQPLLSTLYAASVSRSPARPLRARSTRAASLLIALAVPRSGSLFTASAQQSRRIQRQRMTPSCER